MPLQCGTITYSAILINLNLFRGVQPVLCVMTTDRHPASHPCYRDSLGTLYNSGSLTTESGWCFTAYAMVWSQYHLITSSRPQLLPEDTKPTICKSVATPVCTSRRSSQAQSDYGTVYLQIPATFHWTDSSRSCRRLTWSDHASSFYLTALHGFTSWC